MKRIGKGTKVKIGANSIAELTSIGEVSPSKDMQEITNYDSEWKEYIPGWKDGGEVTIEGTFAPEDANGQKALIDAFNNDTKLAIAIILPAVFGFEIDFDSYVQSYSVNPPMDDKVTFSATLKITGAVTPAQTASGGLTALSLTGAGGALTPTFANGTYYYAFSGVTATSVTVTATAANHTLKLYVDGTYVQDLTSGSASNAITLAAIGAAKKITILANESGKATKIYEVIAVKTA